MKKKEIPEQDLVLKNNKKRMLVSASAGSGKTFVMIEYICNLICEKFIPVKDLLVLTFTKSAAIEMKERLQKRLKSKGESEFITQQLDDLSTANICTIDSFCEKYIKKYANLLNLYENFEIVDENMDKKLKQTSFEKAIKFFEQNYLEDYEDLMFFYKEDKERIKNIIFTIENLVSSVVDKDDFLERNIENPEIFFEEAIVFLVNDTKRKVKLNLDKIKYFHLNELDCDLEICFKSFFESQNIYEILKFKENLKWPSFPTKKIVGEEVAKSIRVLKENINNVFKKLEDLKLENEENISFQKSGKLEKIIINLYKVYEKEEIEYKKLKNFLNFNDLERYMNFLSKQENLFSNFKYVFIDEYQDTNKIQERTIKNVAKNCNFVAVGDVKQGIYGFRLASAEIFLKDMKDFEEDDNSSLNILKSNFRSQQSILDFVNDIFKVCMTKETAEIDYTKSMLVAEGDFVSDNKKAINIDIIEKDVIEEEEKPLIYSVKNAKYANIDFYIKEIKDIKRRIFEVMTSQISEDEALRPCRFGDIAILSRSRNILYQQLELYLQECGIPIVSNTKNKLTEEPEIKVLLCYLKLALNFDDEISLLSVLLSGMYRFDIEEIWKLKQGKTLMDLVVSNEKFSSVISDLTQFRFESNVIGIKKAFVNLFNKTGYRAYLNLKPNQNRLNLFVDKFLEQISISEFQYDLSGLINFFESVEINVTGQVSVVEDAITLTTIHDSKGLEYPIVFLIGCDLSLSGGWPNYDVEINEKFGLALKYFDRENNKETISAKMKAIKDSKVIKEFAEELNLFYVALTRAKNRLYLFGLYNEDNFNKLNIYDCDSYFDLIFFALKKERESFILNKHFINEDREICFIEDVIEDKIENIQDLDNTKINEKAYKKIVNYLDYSYKYSDNLNFKLKESVTELSRKNQEDLLLKYNNDNFIFSGKSVEIGNAYHLALKLVDFNLIYDINDLKEFLKKNDNIIDVSLLDINILYKNIMLLKNISQDGKVYREKEFIMKEKIKNLIENQDFDDEIMVQGAIDLFIEKKDKIILVDYKYSSLDAQSLVKKYKEQLRLYKLALEEFFKKKIDNIYLLSLKNASLIKVNI